MRIVVALGRAHARGSEVDRNRLRLLVAEVVERAYRHAEVVVVLDERADEDHVAVHDDAASAHAASVRKLVAFVAWKHDRERQDRG